MICNDASMGDGVDPLVTYTVFWDPSDYPKMFVVRRFVVTERGPVPDREPLAVEPMYVTALAAIPMGLYNVGREPADHPSVVETWL